MGAPTVQNTKSLEDLQRNATDQRTPVNDISGATIFTATGAGTGTIVSAASAPNGILIHSAMTLSSEGAGAKSSLLIGGSEIVVSYGNYDAAIGVHVATIDRLPQPIKVDAANLTYSIGGSNGRVIIAYTIL